MARALRRLAHADYDPALLPDRPRAYGGHPSPLADDAAVKWVQEQIRAGRPQHVIAAELGYQHSSSFSDAYQARTGERPTEYRDRVGAPTPRRDTGPSGNHRRSIPDRSDETPLPRFDAKPKPKRRRKKKKRATKDAS